MEKNTDAVGIEYKIFSETFLSLKIAGFWTSTVSKPLWWRLCYKFLTLFSYICIFMLSFMTLLDIIISEEKGFFNVIEYWYMIAIYSNVLIKAGNVLIKRNRIIKIVRTNILNERWTSLRDDKEIAMMKTSQTGEQNILRLLMSIFAVNGVCNTINPIISGSEPQMMWDTWSPCDRRVPLCFWVFYFYQAFGYLICSVAHVSCDCIIFNFIERICTHVQIFQHRLKLLPELIKTGEISSAESEQQYLNECIVDHQNIQNAVKEVRGIFTATVFVHFLLSFTVLCTNIYFLSKQPLFSSYFIAVFLYLCCILSQNLFYCWYGYKFTEISADIPYTIFSMDWMKLRKETKKTLRFIMLFASTNISVFDNFIVELSPEMFLKMLKISYSAFNLLQTRK